MSELRTERDSMGQVQVPAQAYYGAQTQRAVENFPISGLVMPRPMIRAVGLIKACAAVALADGHVSGREGALLQGVAAALDCPLPPSIYSGATTDG